MRQYKLIFFKEFKWAKLLFFCIIGVNALFKIKIDFALDILRDIIFDIACIVIIITVFTSNVKMLIRSADFKTWSLSTISTKSSNNISLFFSATDVQNCIMYFFALCESQSRWLLSLINLNFLSETLTVLVYYI